MHLVGAFACSTTCLAQQTIPATGHQAAGSSGSMSYTVGQVAYSTQGSSAGTVAQGVQQPYEFLVMAQNEPLGDPFASALYPNPATQDAELRIIGDPSKTLRMELRNEEGKLLNEAVISGAVAPVPLSNLAAGIYLVHVFEDDHCVNTFRIIKH